MSLDRAARRRGELEIPRPTLSQAIAHLKQTVIHLDSSNQKSPTLEAIRVVVDALTNETPPTAETAN